MLKFPLPDNDRHCSVKQYFRDFCFRIRRIFLCLIQQKIVQDFGDFCGVQEQGFFAEFQFFPQRDPAR